MIRAPVRIDCDLITFLQEPAAVLRVVRTVVEPVPHRLGAGLLQPALLLPHLLPPALPHLPITACMSGLIAY